MKKYTTTLILLIFSFSVFAQRSENEIALREYFVDAEFFLTQEFYVDALNDYIQVYKRGYADNANINYRIGICYLEIPGQKNKSIEYLEKAASAASLKYKASSLNEKLAPIDVYLYLGNAYRVNNRLDDAINAYKKYKTLLPDDELNLHQYADKQIEACAIAMEFMDKPIDLKFENVGDVINSSSDDYNAVVSGDNSTLVFMHKLPFYDAIYLSKKIDGIWTKPENITPQIMSDGNQYVTYISKDGTTIFLSVEDEFNCDIYVSHFVDNRWTKSEPLGSEINTKYWESHASLSDDGNTLYFASNRSGGAGNMDIYVAKKDALGNFSNVQNVKVLNTDLNEDTPYVTADGKSMYFSSQGFVNMGGYDIFKSSIGGSGEWTLPENIGYPISTTDDDLFYYPWNNGEVAYMVRIVDTGYGAMDIFRVIYPAEAFESITEKVSDEVEPIIKEQTSEIESPETSQAKEEESSVTPQAGEAAVTSEETVSLPLITMVLDTSSKQAETNVEKETGAEIIKPVEVKTVEITPVFFEFDRSQISDVGKLELDKLIALQKEFGNIYIELYGFADALGSESYNLSLSEKRAMEAMKYLISKGVEAKQLKAIGKGETDFIAPNTHADGSDNPEGRKLNRRVEFEISGINSNVLIIKRLDPVPKDLKIQNK
jgi:outer membrane protein OmpA-like peptidoglycan-associated protein/tetratricopeptide (TPR) repeat protein